MPDCITNFPIMSSKREQEEDIQKKISDEIAIVVIVAKITMRKPNIRNQR